ncbi:hypothetical protein EX895_001784 [Sporisorium graminicola]|uniref:BZIP domain-containing protein n=1 Tax=Sporisorium graminicola TaxID=280036 RepID=A0A4U7KX59_9BASI|nr:hypothetical protein EX895_001784 [Sporisorium graminicola]TKY89253.1 hypothetical protein EX895_001784 [Sporisorium graminicola]
MAASQPFGRRPSGSFPSDFPVGTDPRLGGAHAYAPHHDHPFPPQPSDAASNNYQYTSGRAPFDHQLPFDGASGANVPSWFYGAAQAPPSSQGIGEPGLPYHLDAYAQHASTAAPNHIAGAPLSMTATAHPPTSSSGPATADFTPKTALLSSVEAAPFAVGPPGHAPTPSLSNTSHPLLAAAAIAATVPRPLDNRRASDESAHPASAGLSLSEAGSSVANGRIRSAPESAGFNGSVSPNSSARMSRSPEDMNAPLSYHAYATATVPSLGGMALGAPNASASMMESIDSWLAPVTSAPLGAGSSSSHLATLATAMSTAKAPSKSKRNISPTEASSADDAQPASHLAADASFHPGSSMSSSDALAGAPFKTSSERRERNKASQRESRKRKQDRLETLESENATLRKALADMKKFSQAISNGAGIRGEDGAEVAPVQLTKFTGAFHLDLIESHLDDESQEAEWKGMIGHRFPAPTSQAKKWDGAFPSVAATTSHSDEADDEEDEEDTAQASAVKGEGDSTAKDKGKATADSSQYASHQVKKAMWEISLNQKRHKAAQSFPSMVAVPELVLYKVCRLYFSTLLPFTTKLKSGIINLRAARETPSFADGFDDLPRFPGDPAFGGSDLYLPKNLMPTEMQMRIGFHPVEIAVLPYPAMRDRILTILSAFHAIEELAQEEEDAAARFSEDASGGALPSGDASTQADQTNTELNDADIRKRTALVADMSAWKPKDYNGAVVMPDKSRVYTYGFLEKPRGSHRLRKPAQRWLDEFFYEVVRTLRVWSPAGDVFDGECFEFKESFFRKYPYMVDGEILRATNRWRRARGEDPIRL